jgi:hypothetical protein
LAQVDDVVTAAGDRAAPGRSPRRRVFDELRGRLRRAHDTCEQVDDRAWADYVTRLDRGLDELATEIARTGESGDGGSAGEHLPYVHATRLEIDGWVLRLDHARDRGASDRDPVRELTERAARRLDDYRRGEATRADVDRTMTEVRAIAGA